jgi:hypothetical protein
VINFRGIRPLCYLAVLVLALAGTYLFKLRTQGIFACTAEGYFSPHAYLGYCNGKAYGDYDHGAFWFALEPDAVGFAANADVLFLGSSRMEFAFSTQATDHWFADAAVAHYLLGFTHTENATFAGPLLARLKPRAKVYVINVDQFFIDRQTEPGADIMNDRNDVRHRYAEKKLWQHAHRMICTRLHAICGKQFAYYRNAQTGHWKSRGVNLGNTSLTTDSLISDQDQWDHYSTLAKNFIAALPVDRSCVILTAVPYPGTLHAQDKAIAAAVGSELVDPQLEGLRTFDGSHLDLPGAERWSKAFYDIAGPRIHRCLGQDANHSVAGG